MAVPGGAGAAHHHLGRLGGSAQGGEHRGERAAHATAAEWGARRGIITEERSRNTRENALFTKALLAKQPASQSLILVTSAFHMRRAAGCFAKVGLHPQLFPADFRATDRSWTPDYWLLPNADALSRWSLLLHELAATWSTR